MGESITKINIIWIWFRILSKIVCLESATVYKLYTYAYACACYHGSCTAITSAIYDNNIVGKK